MAGAVKLVPPCGFAWVAKSMGGRVGLLYVQHHRVWRGEPRGGCPGVCFMLRA